MKQSVIHRESYMRDGVTYEIRVVKEGGGLIVATTARAARSA